MLDQTQSKTRRQKIESTMKITLSFLKSEIEDLEAEILKVQTATLKNPDEMREYESLLEDLNRCRYTADMQEMLIKYF